MVSPLHAAGAIIAGIIALFKLGESRGKQKGKKKKEEELSQEVKEELKEQMREEAEEEFEKEKSQEAHRRAMGRNPPVDLGDSVTLGIKEFESHHSGKNIAVCKKEGFVIFVEGCPNKLDVGDTINAEITSYGRNKTSAEAKYTGIATS
jgi:predicted RNA-binding protein with TRAM domain